MRPLHGIRVVDFSWVGAGSYATKILADLGAEVIKIESTQKVDGIRLSPPFADGESGVNRSGYFADRNTSKRSMLLNLKAEGAVNIALKLIAQSDIVCNNFSPGVMDRLGLSYQTVAEINPKIIYLSMSMNGASGPEKNTRGYGAMMSALTGFHHLSGLPGEIPVGTGTNYPDHIPNPGHAAFVMLAALRHSRKVGVGQQIDMAQTEAMLATLGPEFLDWSANGVDRDPLGNHDEGHFWQDVLPAAGDDRWIVITARNREEWLTILQVLQLKSTLTPTVDIERIRSAVAQRPPQALAHELQQAGVPAAPVLSPPGVINDAQLSFRGHWRELTHAEMGTTLYNGQPFKFSDSDVQPRTSAPLLGEHTDEICQEILQFTPEQITQLRESFVLA